MTIKNKLQAGLLLFGVFVLSGALFFGIGKGVKAMKDNDNDNGGGGKNHTDEMVTPIPPTPPTPKPSLFQVASVNVVFDKIARRYTITPTLSETVESGLVLELYKSASCEGAPVAVSKATAPGRIRSVKQSESSYWLVAKDTLSGKRAPVFEVTGCVPKKISAREIEDAISQNNINDLGKAIPDGALKIVDQNGVRYNYLVALAQMIKNDQWKSVHVTEVFYEDEKGEYRVKGFNFRYTE